MQGLKPVFVLVVGLGLPLSGEVRIVPQPQYYESSKRAVELSAGGTVAIRVGSGEKARLAAEFVRAGLLRSDGSLKVSVQAVPSGKQEAAAVVYLWNYGADQAPPLALNFLDREVLAAGRHYGQSYVIRTPDARSMWVIGGSEQGVLWGAMTVLQLIRRGAKGTEIEGAYVRDYPDFEFRASADWLLNVEVNRWALDRGQGIEAFARLCERKLDAVVRLKINMVLMDGFGWGLEQRFPEYGPLMRRLNRYARARGVRLRFGGYGASYGMAYQGGPIYEDAPYLGKVFENREYYPDGPKYRCMGFPRQRSAEGVDAATLGSCRSNDELNRMKAEELRRFVEAVEPGALYIHHEDFGGFNGTQAVWKERCVRCRSRWPNDALAAKDGGAGGLAHGYSELVRAVNSVKNPDSGYDAGRDCQIILISPVYVPDSPASDDWSNVLELWQNTAVQLPRANNIMIGSREVFPQRPGGGKWTQHFAAAMRAAGLPIGSYLYYSGGADTFYSDYPLTGTPSLNIAFLGARAMENSSGDFYGEPMAGINAEYSWNAHAPGFRDPLTHDEATALDHRYIHEPDQPESVFGKGGVYDRVCELLYGSKAGAVMADYYRESAWLPDVEIQAPKSSNSYYRNSYLPETWNRAYVIPTHWRHLALDSKTWNEQIDNWQYLAAFQPLKIDRKELHRRLARRWGIAAERNRKGAGYVERALAAGPSEESEEDLKFLKELFGVYQPFTEGLRDFHSGFELYLAAQGSDKREAATLFGSAEKKGRAARELAAKAFPHPVDPSGGEVGTLRRLLDRFIESAAAMEKRTTAASQSGR